MDVTIHIPDDIAVHLGANAARRALERLAIEEYRAGNLTHAQVGRLLGFSTPMQTDEFLKREGVELEYTLDDLQSDCATLDRILNR
jgi:predicted HTH domain antitoxin